jgi:hypothetical protein
MTDREKWEQAEMDLRETMKDLEACQKERDHLRRALEWAAVRDRVGVRTALAATEAQA